ncbi:hypothetical protein PGQ11_003019 [Apiospora arundinis]|uniref:Uncharacterized protein n=1 Tax=Apiospora arundinis TaxID=335852 RepID=A0ABR2J4F1_9PEZI
MSSSSTPQHVPQSFNMTDINTSDDDAATVPAEETPNTTPVPDALNDFIDQFTKADKEPPSDLKRVDESVENPQTVTWVAILNGDAITAGVRGYAGTLTAIQMFRDRCIERGRWYDDSIGFIIHPLGGSEHTNRTCQCEPFQVTYWHPVPCTGP